MSDTGKNETAALVTKLIAGTKKRFPNGGQQLTFGGATQTVDQVTTQLNGFVTNRAAVVAAQTDAKAKVDAENAQMVSLMLFIRAFVKFIRSTFGNAADVLADFGLEPTKAPTPPTAEAKAAAVAKREATRAARGTTSKKAKKGIKGNVTATLVVTPAAPAPQPSAPAAAPTPAPSAAAPAGPAPAAPAAVPTKS